MMEMIAGRLQVYHRMQRCLAYLKANPHIVRFIFAGVLNTLVHFVVFAVMDSAGASMVLANVVAFLCANVFAFFVASYFVFQVRVRSLPDYLKFFVASLAGVAISWSVGALCTHLELHPYFSVLGVVLLIPPVSYVLQRFVFWGKGGRSVST